MKDFSVILQELRKEKELSQSQLAKELKISRSTIGMYESGERVPTKSGMEAIADYFNVDMDYLYGKTNIRKKIHINNDGDEYYYLNDDAREIAQFMYEHPEYKILFDASRKVKKEDIEFVKQMLDRFKNE